MGEKRKDQCYLLPGFQRDVRFHGEGDTYFRNSKVGVLIQARTLVIINVLRHDTSTGDVKKEFLCVSFGV